MYHYPSLFIFVGKILDKGDCEDFDPSYYGISCMCLEHETSLNYSLYVHGYYLPLLQ